MHLPQSVEAYYILVLQTLRGPVKGISMGVFVRARNLWAELMGAIAVQIGRLSRYSIRIASLGGGGGIVSKKFVTHNSRSLVTMLEKKFENLIQIERSAFSQINSDLFARCIQEAFPSIIPKTYFEAGACDGLLNSNTKALEDNGWTGVLVEPLPYWHDNLKINRPNSIIHYRALHTESNIYLDFTQSIDPQLSGLTGHQNLDIHSWKRRGSIHKVSTISLQDAMRSLPKDSRCGYLSLDLEGSEYLVLKQFFQTSSLSEFPFIISVEHNFSKNRKRIKDLLGECNYIQVLKLMSGHDSWWISKQLMTS